MNINEAFEVLKKEGITTHIESVRRWIRTGKLNATLHSKKEGYRVETLDLLDFMKTKLSSKRYEEISKEWLIPNQQKPGDQKNIISIENDLEILRSSEKKGTTEFENALKRVVSFQKKLSEAIESINKDKDLLESMEKMEREYIEKNKVDGKGSEGVIKVGRKSEMISKDEDLLESMEKMEHEYIEKNKVNGKKPEDL